MPTFKWADKNDFSKGMIDKKTGEPLKHRDEAGLCTMEIMGDIPPHIGPSGRYIASRSDYRDELERTNSVPRERGMRNDTHGYITDSHASAVGKKVNGETLERWKENRDKAFEAAGLNK